MSMYKNEAMEWDLWSSLTAGLRQGNFDILGQQ